MSVKDPVCGMTLEASDAVAVVEVQGTKYYFCSEDCRAEFEENPAEYTEG